MPIEQICTIVEAAKLNEYAYSFTLEVGDMVKKEGLMAGQFLHIACGEGLLLRRPISVCMVQEDEPQDTARVVFEVRGEGTKWLAQRQVGDKVNVLGPLGNGFTVTPNDRLLLVGGGIGVPPLLGQAAFTAKNSTAILGFRSADRAMLVEDYRDYCEAVYLCSDDGSLGRHGFVDAQLKDILEKDKNFTAVLACGPKPMLKNVAKVAAEYGVPCQVSLEERMACGVGACLGCAVQMADGTMKHVCKDGPVFDAKEVDWNV
ncbi:dihydroorotate dehydrogenase electron transfer subunit [Flavonifractor sp. An112]|uniref:dihydroorotate dehydrogenase electron transfer subunit n=1 Tax=Flavonifractor sp. An112 TaxID=1965544 RepID=UPI00174BE88A|nr:dihydroorotate dehydrogenase electron transfer subunit [Flavonifractor sp. An112]HIZ93094.1 dihydroorotate dehydrogenase electron transfer subunit [Candidatus Flavonifractor avicola]